MNHNHKYIAFEGLDGCGKDTQKNLAIKYIQEKDKYAFIRQIREPSKYTKSGIELSSLLKGSDIDPKVALDLFIKDRAELSELIRSNLVHSHVISSRCFLSSYLYQQTQGLSFEYIDEQHKLHDIIYPDHIIFYSADIEQLEKRINNRGEQREIFEKKEFQQRNHQIALQTIPKISQSNITVIQADGTIEEVFEKTKEVIDQII